MFGLSAISTSFELRALNCAQPGQLDFHSANELSTPVQIQFRTERNRQKYLGPKPLVPNSCPKFPAIPQLCVNPRST